MKQGRTLKSVPLKTAAKELNRSTRTLRDWCFSKKLPAGTYERKGRDWFIFLTKEVYNYAAELRRGPKPSRSTDVR